MAKVLVIYHGNCADGFGAAWAVRYGYLQGILGKMQNIEFHPGVYGEAPPDVSGQHVFLVDFSYKRDVMEELISKAMSVFVIDHHKTAQEELAAINTTERFHCIFDMTQSGAVLTWKHFMPHHVVPKLLRYIEDRDLWKFHLPNSREISASLSSYDFDFDVWDMLVLNIDNALGFQRMVFEGGAIERSRARDIPELIAVTKRRMVIGGHDVPVANLPYKMSSDAGNIMSVGEPFAACYMDRSDARVFSLRSQKIGGVNVADIAKTYGGGGHPNAAGFQAPIGWEGESRTFGYPFICEGMKASFEGDMPLTLAR